jgi:hypothetical protein
MDISYKALLRSILVLFVLLLGAACTGTTEHEPSPTILITETAVLQHAPDSIREIPIPEGVQDPNFIELGDGSGEINFYVPETILKDPFELFSFYRRELPLLGWERCDRDSCSFPTQTDTDVETYYFGSASNGPWVEVGVNTMIEVGSQVTIRFRK